MANVQDVASDFTSMLRQGRFVDAGNRYWAEAVTSLEPIDLSTNIPASVSGIDAARGKAQFRFGEGRIEDLGIDGPFITGDQFALFLDMLITDPATGTARPFTGIAIFTVRDGRIIDEIFFYD